MKNIITTSFKELFTNRHLTVLLSLFLLLTVTFIVYICITVQPNELRIVTHYSAYGVTHFYRDQWVYLLGYAAFAFLVFIIHTGLAMKLYALKGSAFAIFFAWLGIVMIILAWLFELRIAEFS